MEGKQRSFFLSLDLYGTFELCKRNHATHTIYGRLNNLLFMSSTDCLFEARSK